MGFILKKTIKRNFISFHIVPLQSRKGSNRTKRGILQDYYIDSIDYGSGLASIRDIGYVWQK
uniref:Uncharacterized protein n=1 Tax=Helianthus annuus TaxID=4232 RepID=A0A251SEB0_HELAN